MLGGEILEERTGHPSKRTYWYPTYNSSEGEKALTFLKEQVAAGIRGMSLLIEALLSC
jgi:multiple sugar transport system substrate-binding protein